MEGSPTQHFKHQSKGEVSKSSLNRSRMLLFRYRRPSAQNIFLNFTCGCLWQFRHKCETVRRFEVREIRASKLAQLSYRGPGARLQDHERVRRLAPALVRETHDRNFLHGRMPQQNTFHLNGRNIFAAADNYILKPIANFC